MTIEPATTQDAQAIHKIARENGLPSSWVWPVDCHGGVAKHDGRVVAFCALKEVVLDSQPLLAIEEFWHEKTPAGLRGLSALGNNIEEIAQRLSNERKVEVKTGGFVRRASLAQALTCRFYVPQEGQLLTKTFYPQAKQEVA